MQCAEKNFSSSCKNKVIVLLTDGVPNADVNGNASASDTSSANALKVQETTKSTLLRLETQGINIISMMTGMSADDGNTDKNGNIYTGSNFEENLKAIERIFGTPTNPTTGKYYLVKSADVSNIVENDIFKDVMEKVQNPINAVKVIDYFPQDILSNFEITILKPNIGTVSDKIDKETKSIQWEIGTLKGNATATLQYKLKIKNMSKNSPIYNQEIATNDKIILNYKDTNEKDYSVTLSSSPKIKLAEIQKPTTTTTQGATTLSKGKDPTVANKILPNTGGHILIISSIVLVMILIAIGIIQNHKYKDVK